MTRLSTLFVEKDASLAEINPLIVTPAGEVMAIDAKFNFDDNAMFRHPESRRCSIRPRRTPTNCTPRSSA